MKKYKAPFIFMFILVVAVFLLLFFKFFTPSNPKFTISKDADIYVVSYKGVAGYQLKGSKLKQVTADRVEIVKGQINFAVKRAELKNRYAIFSEELPPRGAEGRIVNLDFKTGEIGFNKTLHYAYTSAGRRAIEKLLLCFCSNNRRYLPSNL